MLTIIRECYDGLIHVGVGGSAKHYIILGKRFDHRFVNQTVIEIYSNDLYDDKQTLDD
jgi:hypothetical protein